MHVSSSFIQKNIAEAFASALNQFRGNNDFTINDEMVLLLEPNKDINILNALCSGFEECFSNRTRTYKCFIVENKNIDESFKDFNFNYFNWYNKESEKEFNGKIKLIKENEVDGYKVLCELKQNTSWSKCLENISKDKKQEE